MSSSDVLLSLRGKVLEKPQRKPSHVRIATAVQKRFDRMIRIKRKALLSVLTRRSGLLTMEIFTCRV